MIKLRDPLDKLIENGERIRKELSGVSNQIKEAERALKEFAINTEFSWRTPDGVEFSWKKPTYCNTFRLCLSGKPFIDHPAGVRVKYIKDLPEFIIALNVHVGSDFLSSVSEQSSVLDEDDDKEYKEFVKKNRL